MIIAGGSGTRLWPLSTPDYPKHLLSMAGDDASLLQNTYRRAKNIADTIYVVSETGHIHHVKEQLPELPAESFIAEPARRGTASCIIAALALIRQRHGSDEEVAMLTADHFIRDIRGFTHTFRIASATAKQERKIVLVGVEPYYPATGFGYIKKDGLLDEERFIFKVDAFKEKPDYTTALKYVRSGEYLWNSGYFVGSVSTFEEAMHTYAPELYASYQKLLESSDDAYRDVYLGLEPISIDYALIEKVEDLLVVPASFDWMDLGSFADLAKVVGSDIDGNHTEGNVQLDEVSNTMVQNLEGKPLAVIGLDNCVVVNSPAGILIVRKDLSQMVGEISKRFNKEKEK